jgi:ribosomal protein L24E
VQIVGIDGAVLAETTTGAMADPGWSFRQLSGGARSVLVTPPPGSQLAPTTVAVTVPATGLLTVPPVTLAATVPPPTTTTPVASLPVVVPEPEVLPSTATPGGYLLADAAGVVYGFGGATTRGNGAAGTVDIEATPTGEGYWTVSADGRVVAHGDARALGSASDLARAETVSSISATPDGAGYWLFTTRGRAIEFGNAADAGDLVGLGVTLNAPVLDSVATPSGRGYYMVAADGGVFAFGDAVFSGSTGSIRLNAPVESLVPDPDGSGYWLVARDGGVFAFDAEFRGSMGGRPLNQPVTGMVAYGNGYLMVATDGGVFTFSDRAFAGSLGANPPSSPVVAIAAG